MVEESGVVQKLEERVAEALRDRALLAQVPGNSGAGQLAVTEYAQMAQDSSFSEGIRYLALCCVAHKSGFYHDAREQPEMLGMVAQKMGNLQPGEVVEEIHALKDKYRAIYQLDPAWFDRYEAHAVEFMTRLPVDLQDQTVAAGKNTQLQARPIAPEEPVVLKPVVPQPVTYQPTPAVPTVQPTPGWAEPPNYATATNQVYRPTAAPISPTAPPEQHNNKNALIIGGSMIAGAVVFSSLLLSQQFKSGTSTTGVLPSPSEISTAPSPTVSISSSTNIRTTQSLPENLIGEYYQHINSRQYEMAWNMLPVDLRENHEIHPNGFGSFTDFFDQFSNIQVNNLSINNRDDYSAVVNANLMCQAKNGNIAPLFLRFHLYWNSNEQKWQISKVKFNPNFHSTCGV